MNSRNEAPIIAKKAGSRKRHIWPSLALVWQDLTSVRQHAAATADGRICSNIAEASVGRGVAGGGMLHGGLQCGGAASALYFTNFFEFRDL